MPRLATLVIFTGTGKHFSRPAPVPISISRRRPRREQPTRRASTPPARMGERATVAGCGVQHGPARARHHHRGVERASSSPRWVAVRSSRISDSHGPSDRRRGLLHAVTAGDRHRGEPDVEGVAAAHAHRRPSPPRRRSDWSSAANGSKRDELLAWGILDGHRSSRDIASLMDAKPHWSGQRGTRPSRRSPRR